MKKNKKWSSDDKMKKIALLCVAVVVVGVAAFYALSSKKTNGPSDNEKFPIPLTENTFFIEKEKDKVGTRAEELKIKLSKLTPVHTFDITGDGVPEGVYATDRKDQFVMFMQGENNSITEARRYMKLEDSVGQSTVLTLTKSSTANYFLDKENHSIVQYDTADGCDILVYRWEQVKKGFVMIMGSQIGKKQQEGYCTHIKDNR